MLVNLIGGHTIAPERFRNREMQMCKASATYIFFLESVTCIYISHFSFTFSFSLAAFLFMLITSSDFHCCCSLIFIFISFPFSLPTFFNQLTSALLSQLHVFSYQLSTLHLPSSISTCPFSLIIPLSNLQSWLSAHVPDPTLVFILQSISLNLSYRNVPRLLFPCEFQIYLCKLGKITLSKVHVIFPMWTLISYVVLTQQ